MMRCRSIVELSLDIAQAYQNCQHSDQDFILNLSLFLANFLSNHLRILETPRCTDVLLNAHLYLIKISQVEEQEIFKICLEYWVHLVAEIYGEMRDASVGGEFFTQFQALD